MFLMQLKLTYGSPAREKSNAVCLEDNAGQIDAINYSVFFGVLQSHQYPSKSEDFYCRDQSLLSSKFERLTARILHFHGIFIWTKHFAAMVKNSYVVSWFSKIFSFY